MARYIAGRLFLLEGDRANPAAVLLYICVPFPSVLLELAERDVSGHVPRFDAR